MNNRTFNMRHFLLMLIALTIGMGSAWAQPSLFPYHDEMVPNYKKIKKYTTDPNNQYYYPKLKQRFLEGDTNLTFEECHYLYYGSIFAEGYFGYGDSDFIDSADYYGNLITDSMPEEQVIALHNKALDFAKKAIHDNPHRLKHYVYVLSILDILQRYDEMELYKEMLYCVLFPIYKSGDGSSPKKALHTVSISDEYEFLHIYDFNVIGQQLVFIKKKPYDLMEASRYDDDTTYQIYFYVSHIMSSFKL